MAGTPTVAKSPPALIPPAGPTPGGTLPLSCIDKTFGGSGFVSLIQVFPPSSLSAAHNDEGTAAVVAAMRSGFARALVPYYPVAGRVAPSGLAVDCTGEGVWFVEAAASCTRADVGGLECSPLLIPGELLLPRPPPGEKLDGVIFMAQVTRFTCGGLAVAISFAASTRHLLRGVLPAVDGYYGNCVYMACVARTSRAARELALAELVGAVREAKEAVAAGFADWMRGVGRYDVPLDYSTATLLDWGRLGFDEVDYGFGVPGYVCPHEEQVNFAATLLFVRPPAPRRGGVRVLLRCVEEPHAAMFAAELAKFA